MGRKTPLEQIRQQSIERMHQERMNRLHKERKDRPILLEAEKKKTGAGPQPPAAGAAAASSSSGGNAVPQPVPPVPPVPPEPPTPEDVEIYVEIIDTWGDGGEIAMVKHIDHYSLGHPNKELDIPCLGGPLPLLNTDEPTAFPGCVVDLELDVTGSETQLICPSRTPPILPPGNPIGIEGTFTLPASAPRPALLLFSMWVHSWPEEANFRFTINGTCIAAKGVGAVQLPCANMIMDPFPTPIPSSLGGKWYHMYATIKANGDVQYMWDPDGTKVYP